MGHRREGEEIPLLERVRSWGSRGRFGRVRGYGKYHYKSMGLNCFLKAERTYATINTAYALLSAPLTHKPSGTDNRDKITCKLYTAKN